MLSSLTSIKKVRNSQNNRDKQLLIVGLALEGLLLLVIISLIFWPIQPNITIHWP
jgi:hypothetical protein